MASGSCLLKEVDVLAVDGMEWFGARNARVVHIVN